MESDLPISRLGWLARRPQPRVLLLPVEILMEIFFHAIRVDDSDYYATTERVSVFFNRRLQDERASGSCTTLCSLALVSRRFNDIVTPFIYRRAVITEKNSHLLLHTFLTTPCLAQLVRQVLLDLKALGPRVSTQLIQAAEPHITALFSFLTGVEVLTIHLETYSRFDDPILSNTLARAISAAVSPTLQMLSLHGGALYLFDRSEFENLASSAKDLKSYVFDCKTSTSPLESHPAFVTQNVDHFSYVYHIEDHADCWDLGFRNITHLTLSIECCEGQELQLVQDLYDSIAKECPELVYLALYGCIKDFSSFLKVSPPPARCFELIHEDRLEENYSCVCKSKHVCRIFDGISGMGTGVRLVKINAPDFMRLLAEYLKKGRNREAIVKMRNSLDRLFKREFDVVSSEDGTAMEDVFGWTRA